MNKIYKVIWSKVKNQYVVVSELAHSNGKQSRTSRNSIRSRIAALVVCGAITAFGVYGALPNSVYAENNTKAWQYAAISIEANPDFGEYRDEYHLENVQVNGKSKTYWVRDGYHIDVEQVHRYDSDDTTNVSGTPTPMPVYDDVIRVYRNDDWEESNANGLLSSMKVSNSNMGITTLNGKDLQDITAGTFVGASSGGGTEVPSNYNYLINDNGKWVDAGNEKFEDYFKTVTYDNTLGGYTYNNQLVDPQNVYFIDGQAGVFLVSGVNGEKEVYKGAVYGAYNEILVTGKDSNGNYYSYWGAERTDPNETIGDKLTVGQYNNTISWLNDNIRDIHEDDIKQIQVKATDNGGTIGLQTNGEADSKGNPTGGKNIPGTITIKNPTIDSGTNGKDVKIQFGSIGEDGKTDVAKFTVDAGSKVEGLKDEATAKDGDTLTGLKINGVEYDLSQGKTYSPGQGIAISDDNKISVDKGDGLEFTSNADDAKLEVNANEDKGIIVNSSGVAVNAGEGLAFETEGTDKGKLKVNVGDGLSINGSNQIVNNLKVAKLDDLENKHDNGGNWTITDSKANITLTNTTLDEADSNNYNSDESNLIKGAKDTSYENTKYGRNYKVIDTDGNEVALNDVASADTLKTIDTTKIGNLKYDSITGTEISKNDSVTAAIGKLDNKVNGGWNAVVNGTKINVTPQGNKNTLEFAAGNNVSITPDVENNKITIATDLSDLSADETNAVLYDETNKKSVTLGNGKNEYVTGTTGTGVKLTNVAYATGDDGSEAVNVDYLEDTVDSINKASYKGWTVSANGETNKVAVPSNGNVDFSNTDGNIIVGQNGTNLRFDLNDNITLGDESGTRIQLNGNPQKDSMISITNKDSDTVFNIAKDGTVHSDGDIVAKADSNKKYSLSEVGENAVRYNENKSTVALAGTNGTTITNVADGDVSEGSKEAVNGSQLYATNQKVDAGWVATDGTNKIEVNPTDSGTTTLNFAGDNNITVTADTTNKAIQVALNDKVYLGGDHTEDSRNIVLDGERGVIGLGSNIALDGRDGTAVIGGVNITTTAEEGTGKPVSTINGLSNTTWTGTTETPNRAATEGQLEDLSDTVNTGWYVADKNTAEDSTTGNFAVKPGETLTFNGDDNIDVEAKDHEVNVSLNDNITLGEGNSQININGNPENGEAALSIGDKFVVEQNGSVSIKADNTETYGTDTTVTINPDGVKFEKYGNGTTVINGQTIQAGGVVINGEDNGVYKGTITGLTNTTLDDETFATVGRAATEEQLKQAAAASKTTVSNGTNTTVTSVTDPTDGHVDYQVNLNDNVYLGGNRTAQNSNIKLDGEKGNIQVGSNIALLGEDGRAIIGGVDISTTFDDIGKKSATITGLSNTTWDADKVVIDRAATEGQLQMVSDKVTAGWTATDDAGNKINVNPETRPTLNFASGKNITVSANEDSGEVEVSLNDNINLNNRVYINGDPEEGNNTIVDIKSSDTSKEESIFAVEDKGNGSISIGGIDITNVDGPYLAVGDGKLKFYKDGGLSTGNATGTFSVRPDGDLEINGKNSSFNVDAETGNVNAINNSGSAIMMNDDSVALNASGNGVVISDEGITLNTNGSAVTVDRFNGATFTNTNTGETTNINGDIITTDTVKGLSNTTWDDELATQVANSEELQGTAATQGQLQQAVSAVATEAAKQHTTVSGDDNLTVKSSVNENGGTNYQVTLDDDITLGNPKAGNTEGKRSFTINTTDPNGYVPESYAKPGSGADFIEENGGFMLFATNTQGFGVFGVTAKGSAWAKDFKTYTTDIYGNNTQYSLNEIGDAVAQMSSYYNEENGKSYTVFSRYLNEAEKDKPFVTVDGATRDIPLALRDDGAVLIGATIEGDDFTDNGIRINAETETTYDENGKEVTNNVATITGLENTTWTPPAPVATFANEGTETSRAATEAQLNDLYNTVAAYDVNADGTVNYNHITLAGTPYNYGLSRSTDGTPTGGTSITNVAYASGNDGSEAVNVDYLKDTINKAVEAGGSISNSDKHLVANTAEGSNGVYKPNAEGNVNLIVSDEKGNSSTVTIGDVASKTELDSLKTNVGDLNYDKVTGDKLVNGDSVTTAIGKLDNKIDNISGTATNADNNTVTGGTIKDDGTISLTQKDGDTVALDGKLTDSGVVQDGTSFDKETGTITITSQDKYSGETSSVKVEGIASTEVVGATNKEDLATAYKDADKDGNATTEYITDSESMVEADVALDHAIQDVAGTSYANDMVLSNRIDSVEKRLGNVEERIDKVGAMAAAIANLRTMGFDPEAPTEIAIGVGQYKSETGIAIGVFHYPNQDFMLSASLSSSGDELMGGIGATWKLGRKSAAERAKDEEARHLEQAEEMKKLAQQEKVKAQAQRHAKLLAERQQASQKNA